MPKKKSLVLFGSMRVLTGTAMLTAASVIIGIFCKNFLNFGAGLFRITFENLPILLTGLCFGPVAGGLCGAATDVISYFLSGQAYPINPLVTLGAALIGMISGVLARYVLRRPGYARIVLCCIAAHLVGSVLVKSVGLFAFYGWAVLWRIPLYALIAGMEIFLLCLLYKSAALRRMIDPHGGDRHDLP